MQEPILHPDSNLRLAARHAPGLRTTADTPVAWGMNRDGLPALPQTGMTEMTKPPRNLQTLLSMRVLRCTFNETRYRGVERSGAHGGPPFSTDADSN